MNIMKHMSAADLVWVATALLHREHPKSTGFVPRDIARKVLATEPQHSLDPKTISQHISKHCVANKKPDPSRHRILFQNEDGSYRLYRSGDPFSEGRENGKITPEPAVLAVKYADLLHWYRDEFDQGPIPDRNEDPLLELRGLGSEVWKELGGGEWFIRELRSNWYPNEQSDARQAEHSPGRKRSA